mmetsp:Transcript_22900/g.68742  ORF Transcript_22900/g.68742 Transcript_22900/m.68742 type:complete len:124 (+) Transcript_22900:115-486(+)
MLSAKTCTMLSLLTAAAAFNAPAQFAQSSRRRALAARGAFTTAAAPTTSRGRRSALRGPASSLALRAGDDEDDAGNYVPPQQEYDVEGFQLDALKEPQNLTLLAFGLIAFNFFFLAGFGSGGL